MSKPETSQPDWLLKLFKIFWGSTHAKFASLLVLVGGALVATPFWQVVAQWALGMPADSADTWVRIFGAFMVAAGIGIFVYFHNIDVKSGTKQVATAGAISFSVPERASFEAVAGLLGQFCKKNVILEGFSDAQRKAVLKPIELNCPSLASALAELGHLAAVEKIPAYDVLPVGERLILRVRPS